MHTLFFFFASLYLRLLLRLRSTLPFNTLLALGLMAYSTFKSYSSHILYIILLLVKVIWFYKDIPFYISLNVHVLNLLCLCLYLSTDFIFICIVYLHPSDIIQSQVHQTPVLFYQFTPSNVLERSVASYKLTLRVMQALPLFGIYLLHAIKIPVYWISFLYLPVL